MIQDLVMQSAGAGLGIFVGCLIGLSIRARQGKREGLMGNSVLLTSSAAGGAALVVMMAVKSATMG